ncbi:hypothetical protein AXG93_638s1490 [Marchantia polymorpha subsp. ruderalis]|uniref:Uncharacterized protein n=1 Tax=Marchantia polymorpha subsp. ruderalis TaxID=1480154 RepID=A0A176W577_MARPO|nr:hypothetical protein AXG93_638s1490 [Marchantia polymorpha subsp. ruderalis]
MCVRMYFGGAERDERRRQVMTAAEARHKDAHMKDLFEEQEDFRTGQNVLTIHEAQGLHGFGWMYSAVQDERTCFVVQNSVRLFACKGCNLHMAPLRLSLSSAAGLDDGALDHSVRSVGYSLSRVVLFKAFAEDWGFLKHIFATIVAVVARLASCRVATGKSGVFV